MRPLFSLLLLPLFFTSCFGIDRRGGIVKYRDGEVYSGRGSFRVGPLPPSWTGPKIRLKQLVYENDETGGTIVTDALCGPKFNDAPLPRLAADLFQWLEGRKTDPGRELIVDGRAAYRVQGSGRMDGVPLKMDVLVMKKNFCLYDFIYFAPLESFSRGVEDFEEYFHGLRVR